METVTDIKEMQALSMRLWKEGKTIVLVPTMGFFHDGHLRLFEEGKRCGDTLIVSIFVNPTQFGQGEDYNTYPRDPVRDKSLAESSGVDILFLPRVSEMYPHGFQTYVTVERLTRNLCGAFRPNHFRGVATVVTKLFNITMPHKAIFGEKDFQQLLTIKRLVNDLNLNIEILSIPTVRERDGLALSSRNAYLNSEERKSASILYRALLEGKRLYRSDEREAEKIIGATKSILMKDPRVSIEYVKVCHPDSLEDIERVEDKGLLALAARIGKARLIDHIILE